jgi:membrane associated rhomboid family serine protease
MAEPTPPVHEPHQQQQAAMRAQLAEAMHRRLQLVPALMGLLIAVGLLQFSADAWLGPHGSDELLLAGAHIPARVLRGEWWRLFTAPWLHGDWSHLLLNTMSVFVVGRPVEAAYGPARAWIIWSGAALAGAMATLQHGAPLSVGASGGVFGLLGAMLGLGLKLWPRLQTGLRVTLVWMPSLLLIGTVAVGLWMGGQSGIDHHAHVGGGLGGLCLGLVLRPQLRPADARPGQRAGATLRGIGWAMAIAVGVAVLLAVLRVGRPIDLPPQRRAFFDYDGLQIPFPADARRGVVRDNRCTGTLVDPAWALRTGRRPCFQLPLGAMLEVGTRAQLLTLDPGDFKTLHAANRSGKFARREPQVMLYPLGERLLYVLIAPEPLLASHAATLNGLVPPAGSAHVDEAAEAPKPVKEPDFELMLPPSATGEDALFPAPAASATSTSNPSEAR